MYQELQKSIIIIILIHPITTGKYLNTLGKNKIKGILIIQL